MDNVLIAFAGGGLCNRLKTVVSAHRIAADTGRTLYVYWDPMLSWNPDGIEQKMPWPGGWRELFVEPLNEVSWNQMGDLDWLPLPRQEQQWDNNVIQRGDRRPAIIKAGWRWLRYEDEPDVDLLLSGETTAAQWQVIAAVQRFMPVARAVPSIQAKVDRFVEEQGIGKRWIGLHVRTRHLFCRAIPMEAYLTAVNNAIEDDPAVVFFLASDSLEADRFLLEQFPGRMVTYPKETDDPIEGLRNGDALIDLLLLARTRHIIGAAGSTFNEVAWWLTGCSVPNQLVYPAAEAQP